MLTHENDGLYRNVKTGKVVHVTDTSHWSDGQVKIYFRGTRDEKPFGRTFSTSIEDFFDRHMWLD